MKKEIIILSAVLTFNLPVSFFLGEAGIFNCCAQFPFSVGAASNDASNEIVLDGSSNAYVTGYFQGTADFDPGASTANFISAGGFEIYVVKYNSAGAYQWAFSVGSASNDVGYDIATDGNSNVYVTGYFQGTADFDPGAGSANLTSVGTQDIFVAKYNSAGAYQWAFSVGSASDDYGYGIATDANSNVFVTGYFQGTTDFDPGAGSANLTSAGTQDIFVAKYNSAGAYQWAFSVGAASNDVGYGIVADGSSNVYVTGYFQGTADFDPGAITANLIAVGNQDIFIAKYNSAGAYQWAFNVGSASNDASTGIVADGSSNVYVIGSFQGTADFDPGVVTANLITVGVSDIFVAKYNSSGIYQWAFSVGSSSFDYCYGIALDGSSNAYVTGNFQGAADFDPGIGAANLTPVGTTDIYVAKYNSAGAYQCAFNMGSTIGDVGLGIVADANSNAYVTGYFQGTADFDPGASTSNLITVGVSDIFVVKYNSSGAYQWAFSVGSASFDYCYGIALDGSSNAYITGNFQGAADFDPGAGTANLTPVGTTDIYVAKYNSEGTYQCAFNVGSAIGDVGLGIAADNNSNAYVTGYFQGSADFDPGAGTVNLTPAGGQDIFIAKYDIACNIVVFPVEILSFSSICEKKDVKLFWQTASEQNNDYFTIERSADGLQWKEIGTVKGANNSSSIQHYEFSDLLPEYSGEGWGGALYYRLKQTDFDGKYEYFGPVSVKCDSENEIMILPTISDKGYFAITGLSEDANIAVYNLQGQKIYSTAINKQSYILDISNFIKGHYMVHIVICEKVWNKKIMLVK